MLMQQAADAILSRGKEGAILSLKLISQNSRTNFAPAVFTCAGSFRCAACGGLRASVLENFNLKIFDDLVGEQFFAGAAQQVLRRRAITKSELDIKNLSLPHAVDAIDPERF